MHRTDPITPSETDYRSVLECAGANGASVYLDYLTLVSVTGDDTESFLQNQLSNDIPAIPDGRVQLNAYCNPKGRALAILRLLKRPGGGFWMLVPSDLAESLIKRLRIYVMRAKVDIRVDDENAMIGLIGRRPASMNASEFDYGGHIERTIAIGQPAALAELAGGSDAFLGGDFWKLCDILSGLPQVYGQTVGECIPQHVNMDIVNGISFSKGCYPGQEIIARLKYLGKSKYRLCAATAEIPKPVFPGEPLFTSEQPRQKAGVVIDAVTTGKGRCCLSAMLKIDRGEHPRVYLGSADGPGLTLGSLPYSVPVE